MDGVNLVAVVVAAVAVWVVSTVYYIGFTKQMAELHPAYAGGAAARPAPWQIGVELTRNLVLASVVAWLAQGLEATDWTGGMALGLILWLGFPIVLWTGAVVWEKASAKLAAIHAGDWLLKLLVIAVLVTVWR